MAHCQGWRLLRSTDDVPKWIWGLVNVEIKEYKMKEHQTSYHFIFLVDITLHQFCSLYYYTLYILYIYTYIFYAHKRHMQIIIYNMHYTSETTYLTYLLFITWIATINTRLLHFSIEIELISLQPTVAGGSSLSTQLDCPLDTWQQSNKCYLPSCCHDVSLHSA